MISVIELGVKEWFGIASVLFAILNYLPYLIGSLTGKLTPHIFTWSLWFVLTSTAFYAQLISDGGMGAWATGTTAVILFLITLSAARRGFGYVRPFDWVALGSAVFSIVLWVVTNDPFWSVILISVIHSICFLPTFRKGFAMPHQESITAFILTIMKYGSAIIALGSYSVETVLFPATIMTTSFLFITMIEVRRLRGKAKLYKY